MAAEDSPDNLRLQSLERLRRVVEVAGLATWDWDIQTGHIEWSPAHFRMAGYEPDEVQPSYENWAARVHPDDFAITRTVLEAAKAFPGVYAHTFRFLHPDGAVVWCKARGHYFYDEAGRPARMSGLMDDITELMVSSEHQEALLNRQDVLVAELQHRTRNLLAVVQSISAKTLASSETLDDFSPRFNARLSALSRVQGLLSRASSARITIGTLVGMELEALGGKAMRGRIVLSGPEVRIRTSAVQTLALALHELATNALKYGSLATDHGALLVRWWVDDEPERRLNLEWLEQGVRGPKRSKPRRGYGRELIERALPYALGARTEFEIGEETVRCMIELPLERLAGQDAIP